jgi:hypothetical protein
MANGRCRNHGGLSRPSGPSHPTYKDGRYSRLSKALPGRMKQAYEAMLEDSELLSVRHLLAVHLARYEDLVSRVDTGESRKLYDELRKAIDAYEEATDEAGRAIAFSSLRGKVYAGYRDWMTWHDVEQTLATILRLADYEKRRLLDMNAVMNVDEVMATMGLLLRAIEEAVTDPRTLGEIQRVLDSSLAVRQEAIAGGGRLRR